LVIAIHLSDEVGPASSFIINILAIAPGGGSYLDSLGIFSCQTIKASGPALPDFPIIRPAWF
jgi:hypothetical protein